MKLGLEVLILLLLVTPILSIAQEANCGFDEQHQRELRRSSEFANNVDRLNSSILNRSGIANGRMATVYTIPVVVHVIHTGEAVGTGPNISVAQINSAIDNLTDAYRNTGYMGVDAEIEFCLATLDKDGNVSTGINRIDGTGTGGVGNLYEDVGINDANQLNVKALSRWPADQYYNIWLVTEIDNNGGGSGTQGYAFFPGANPDRDGTVILYNAFGYDPGGVIGYELKSYTNLGATLIHELGHAFGVYHTFEGDNMGASCPTDTDCTMDGDLVCDTDHHIRNDDPCFTCASGTNSCTGTSENDLVANFMNYSCGTCKDRFTAGQVARVRDGLEVGRPGLTTSVGCSSSAPTFPATALNCIPTTAYTGGGFGMGITKFQMGDIEYYSYHAERDITAYNSTTNYLRSAMGATLIEGMSYSISIETGTLNNEDVEVYIDYDNDGDFTDAGENVFSSISALSHSGSFTVPVSASNTEVWVRVISDWAGNVISGPCYEPQNGQVEDYFVTITTNVPVSLTTFNGHLKEDKVELHWQTASEQNNDYFLIERSLDGRNFEALGTVNGNGTTTEAQSYNLVDTKPAIGTNYYRLTQFDYDGAFEIFQEIVAVDYKGEELFTIRPNPIRSGALQVAYESNQTEDIEILIFNTVGQQMDQQQFAGLAELNQFELSIDDLTPGVYLLQLRQGNQVFSRRFVKAN